MLTPAIVVPATLSPERIASIREGIAEAYAGKTQPVNEVLAQLGITADA